MLKAGTDAHSAGLAGLAIANCLDIAMMANWVLRQLSETEVAMNRYIHSKRHLCQLLQNCIAKQPAAQMSHTAGECMHVVMVM